MGRTNVISALIVLVAVVFLVPACAHAGQFRVSPIKLFFDRNTKSGAVSVINEGDTPIKFQMELVQWSQDTEGKDVYTESDDLNFFPKIMTVEGGDTRIVRAGMKFPAVKEEQTYRLFIRELPEKPQSEGVTIAIAVRFGVPIFIKPLAVTEATSIEDLTLAGGELAVLVNNPGNVHFMINSIQVKGTGSDGEERFSTSVQGWYLLANASRRYAVTISDDVCPTLSSIEVTVDTDRTDATRTLPVNKSMCMH